jgi:hypothetical protein
MQSNLLVAVKKFLNRRLLGPSYTIQHDTGFASERHQILLEVNLALKINSDNITQLNKNFIYEKL